MKSSRREQKRSKNPLLLILAVIITGVIGAAAWLLMKSDKPKPAKADEPEVTCVSDDEIICRFITNWTPPVQYRTVIQDNTAGVNTVTTYEYELNDSDKIRTVVEGAESYEVITIDGVIYTKAGDIWWKQAVESESAEAQSDNQTSTPQNQEFEPLKPSNYSRVGKENCPSAEGSETVDRQCYKYAVNNPDDTSIRQFVWFDDKEYKLRKMAFEAPGSMVEQTFEYVDVAISRPSPVRELGPDQQIIPGELAPTGI